jgi:hypothetical protein
MSCGVSERFSEAVATARAEVAAVAVDDMALPQLRDMVVESRRQVAMLTAAIAQLAVRADERNALLGRGATSPEAFLAGAAHGSVAAARAELDVGRAMFASPVIEEAVASGTVSLDNARLLGSVANHPCFSRDAAQLVTLAAKLSPRRLRDEIAAWRELVDGNAEADREAMLRQRRYLRLTDLPDGMTRIDGLLTAPDAETIRTALDHLIAGHRHDHTGRENGQRCVDALTELCDAYSRGAVTGGRQLPQVSVHIGLHALRTMTGRAATAHGTVSAAEARQWCCDAGISRIITDGRSAVLDAGVTQRTVSDTQWKALVARDRSCVFPGCDRPPAWCHAHHVQFWDDGGATDLANLALVCSGHHHGALHRDGWTLRWQPGTGWIPVDPNGKDHPDSHRPPDLLRHPQPLGHDDDPTHDHRGLTHGGTAPRQLVLTS